MQSANRNSEYPIKRQRCGDCSAFMLCAHDTTRGICAWTNGDEKMPGTVQAAQAVCIYRPSKFKAKARGFQ
jgi:hypothetical protein